MKRIKPDYNVKSMKLIYGVFALITATLMIPALAFCQTKTEIIASQKAYEGRWLNAKLRRHLTINYDTGAGYVTINDWHGVMSENNNTVDAYKAWSRNGKLVMPGSNTDLKSPYCEIVKKGKRLLYRCKGMNAGASKFVDSVWFVRERR